MNDSKLGITRENLLLIVPPALTHDPAMMARAAVDAEALAARLAEIDRVRIISNIDALDETVLDILARDFKVDWYDPGYSLEEKRRTVKSSWRVHKILGTKAAVETAIRAIYPQATVKEWFEYGGKPYSFRIYLDMTGEVWSEERPRRILERVEFYKSLRSHLDGLEFTTVLQPTTLHIGGAPGAITCMGIPAAADAPAFSAPLHVGGAFGAGQSFFVPEDPSPPSATTILRTGGVCTIISNLSKGE